MESGINVNSPSTFLCKIHTSQPPFCEVHSAQLSAWLFVTYFEKSILELRRSVRIASFCVLFLLCELLWP